MKNGKYVKGELHKFCLKQRFYEIKTNAKLSKAEGGFYLVIVHSKPFSIPKRSIGRNSELKKGRILYKLERWLVTCNPS